MRKATFTQVAPTPLRDLGEDYIDAFVTFIDILGFSNLVATNTSNEVRKQLLATKFFHSVPQLIEKSNLSELFTPISTQFSDSIIRIQPVPANDEDSDDRKSDYFLNELSSLLLAQGNLACNGVFVRGGMTFGKVSVSKSGVFGPAFIRAYKIESTLALYPRIVIDQKLIGNSRDPLRQIAWEDLSQYVHQDSDGQWFIQYLSHLCEASETEGHSPLEVLKAHRDKVQKNLRLAQKEGREEVAAKYSWVANYHNRLITNVYHEIDRILYEERQESLLVELDKDKLY
jgi:hypothetical protein